MGDLVLNIEDHILYLSRYFQDGYETINTDEDATDIP